MLGGGQYSGFQSVEQKLPKRLVVTGKLEYPVLEKYKGLFDWKLSKLDMLFTLVVLFGWFFFCCLFYQF